MIKEKIKSFFENSVCLESGSIIYNFVNIAMRCLLAFSCYLLFVMLYFLVEAYIYNFNASVESIQTVSFVLGIIFSTVIFQKCIEEIEEEETL